MVDIEHVPPEVEEAQRKVVIRNLVKKVLQSKGDKILDVKLKTALEDERSFVDFSLLGKIPDDMNLKGYFIVKVIENYNPETFGYYIGHHQSEALREFNIEEEEIIPLGNNKYMIRLKSPLIIKEAMDIL